MKRRTRVALSLGVVVVVVVVVMSTVHLTPPSLLSLTDNSSTASGTAAAASDANKGRALHWNTRQDSPTVLQQRTLEGTAPVPQSLAAGDATLSAGATQRLVSGASSVTDQDQMIPDWWHQSWLRSASSGSLHVHVGDSPLFPPCTSSRASPGAYSFVEPRKYIPNSRNPCWYDQPKSGKGLRCVPFFYLAGVAKCGTTDIAKRLKRHPQVLGGRQKEFHWWERGRFGDFSDDSITLNGEGQPFREYVNDLTREFIENFEKEININGSSNRIFGDYSPSYLWDPKYWKALEGNSRCEEPRVIVAQHIRHVFPEAKVILTFRHPTPRLYSRFRSRIHRTPWLKSSPEDFHRYVTHGVKVYTECMRKWSVRHCAYSSDNYDNSIVRLVEGMYPVFMADWLRVWPREQMFIMRYEDYGGHERQRLTELFTFLQLDSLTERQMDHVMEMDVANSGSADYRKYGEMLPETKQMLDDFYRPFVLQFAHILNDTRFLWKDVYH